MFVAKEINKLLARNRHMGKKINEIRVSQMDLENPSDTQRKKWAELQTDEVERLYDLINSKLTHMPKESWTAWDVESLRKVEAILFSRKAEEVRRDITRVMELAGLSYWHERERYWKRVEMLKKLEANRGTGEKGKQ